MCTYMLSERDLEMGCRRSARAGAGAGAVSSGRGANALTRSRIRPYKTTAYNLAAEVSKCAKMREKYK